MADYKLNHTGAEIDSAVDKVDSNWSTLMANLGVGRWANQTFYPIYRWTTTITFYDDLMPKYTAYQRMFNKSSCSLPMYLDKDINPNEITFSCNWMFREFDCKEIHFKNCNLFGYGIFYNSTVERILIDDGYTGSLYDTNWETTGVFEGCSNLVEIGAFNLSRYGFAGEVRNMFSGCSSLKTIHCTHFGVSFNISASTAFEESDLVEIISNLDTVTTAQTLTMGATNLAKLTDDEKKVATDKGWVLA